jgi:TonB family protein
VRNDRSLFRRALEVSLLLHLLLLFVVVPRAREVWPTTLSSAPIFEVTPPEDSVAQPPLEFEFVELANEREERPTTDRAPLSDLDRRAHGGQGEAASDSPGSIGNTFQLVQSEGGDILDRGAPPSQLSPPIRQVPVPEPETERDEVERRDEQTEPEPEGAGELAPEPDSAQPQLRLPPTDAWTLPPSAGGLPENPEREGGAVDEGGLSFDTQWYDWGPYAKKMLAKIRRNWRIPEIARLGVEGVVKIRFFIERDGTVTGLRIIDESGKPPMDFAARDAIGDSSPFEPLPSALTGVEREGVTITFYYNARPPERGGY